MNFHQNSPYEYTDFSITGIRVYCKYVQRRTYFLKGLNEIFPYCLQFRPNLKDFGTGYFCEHIFCGSAVAQWLRFCATNRKVAGSIQADVIDIKSFRLHYGPGVDSVCNRNEYQEHFLGVKAAGA